MNSLLKLATDAHGGLERWNKLTSPTARLSVTGAIWQVKRKLDVLKNIQIDLTLHVERVITHLIGRDKRFFFTPSRVATENEQGKTLDARNEPRSFFEGHSFNTPWNDLHVAYFDSYALWTYLTTPFLYAHPGFVTEKLPPWHEGGEEWQPLKAVFPHTIASHSREQISYFGSDGLLRRHEYTVDIMGGARGLNYAFDYRNFDGIMIPTKRRILGFDDNKHKIPEPVLVVIEIRELAFQ